MRKEYLLKLLNNKIYTTEKCPLCCRNHGKKMSFETMLLKLPLGCCLIKCKCGLIRISEPSKFIININYDLLHREWGTFKNKKSDQIIDNKIKKLINSYKGSKGSLLEIGCGSGEILKKFKDMGWKAKGLEISLDAINYCRNQNLDVIYGNFLDIEFQENFDLILMSHVLEHVLDFEKYLKKVHKLLNKNGRVVLFIPYEFRGLWYIIYKYLKRKVLMEMYNVKTGHIYFFSPKIIALIFSKVGFTIEKLKVNVNPPGGKNSLIGLLRKVFKIYRDIPEIEVWAKPKK